MTSPSDTSLIDYLASAGGSTYCTADLDTKIYRVVEVGVDNVKGICTALGFEYGTDAPRGETPTWRRIERRLQWMRKKRFLRFNRHKGWKVLPVEQSVGAA